MKVTVRNLKQADIIKKTLEAAAEYLNIPLKTEVYISFTTAEDIKQINSRTRNKNEVTDVLSFPYIEMKGGVMPPARKEDINPSTKNVMLGDILICRERAEEQALNYGHSLIREYAYLALHGLLHILGFHHYMPRDKEKMRAIEEKILNELNITRQD